MVSSLRCDTAISFDFKGLFAIMKKTDKLVRDLITDIEGKDVLEVACGTADFSIAASTYASKISCIDLDDSRLHKQLLNKKINFEIMNASAMTYPGETFDTIVIYNAFAHIESQWESIKAECLRVLKPSRILYIVSSWKLDNSILSDTFGKDAFQTDEFMIVKLCK